MKKFRVCIVGASGLVGRTLINCIHEINFPFFQIKLFASQNSDGKKIKTVLGNFTLNKLTYNSFENSDIAFFCVNNKLAEEYVPHAIKAGCIAIDNSSFFRLKKNVPLIIPEVNLQAYCGQKIIANPNCATIQCVLPLAHLNKEFGLTAVNYTTYQSVSGYGKKGLDSLHNSHIGIDDGIFQCPVSKTCIAQIGDINTDGYSDEEHKMIAETKKIMANKKIKVSATCVRVPIEHCHLISVLATFKKRINLDKVIDILSSINGVKLCGDRGIGFPTSIMAEGNNTIYIGRIRIDKSKANSLLFTTCSDNLRKGAAANAVQIAMGLINENKL